MTEIDGGDTSTLIVGAAAAGNAQPTPSTAFHFQPAAASQLPASASTRQEAFIANEMLRIMRLREVLASRGGTVPSQKEQKNRDLEPPSLYGSNFSHVASAFHQALRTMTKLSLCCRRFWKAMTLRV